MAASKTELNYYRLLGVAYTATNREITRAYRDAMKATHPDRVGEQERQAAEERAKLLNLAFQTLTRPADRLVYDRTLRQEVVQEQIMSIISAAWACRDRRVIALATRFGISRRRATRRSERIPSAARSLPFY